MADALFEDHGVPNTSWSEVRAAQACDSPDGVTALDSLLTRYRTPLILYLRRKFSLSREDAEDTLHTFIERKILRQNFLASATPARGRFRTFLFTSLDYFVYSERRRRQARKRAPGNDLLPLHYLNEEELAESRDCPQVKDEYDWPRFAITGALLNMAHECHREGRESVWGVFLERLLEPALVDCDQTPYDLLIQRYQLDSPSSAFNLLNSAKRKFKRQLRQVLVDFAAMDPEAEADLRDLRRRMGVPLDS